MDKPKIGELLLNAGLITHLQLVEALQDQGTYGGRLGTIILEKNWITEKEYMLALSSQLGIPAVNLSGRVIPEEVIKLVPKNLAWEFMVFPVELEDSPQGPILVLAMADPTEKEEIGRLQRVVKHKIKPVLALERTIRHMLMEYYQTNYGNGDYKYKEPLEFYPMSSSAPAASGLLGGEPRELVPPEPGLLLGPAPGGDELDLPDGSRAGRRSAEDILLEEKLSREHSRFSLELKAFLTLLSRKGIISAGEYVDTLKELNRANVSP